jgi:hypothetical protein
MDVLTHWQIINTGTAAQTVGVGLTGSSLVRPTVRAWYTDNTHDMNETAVTVGADGTASANVPGRGMISFLVEGAKNGTVLGRA